jgi:cation diffusion facilitator CzcD-associated flavoprotein CzcO
MIDSQRKSEHAGHEPARNYDAVIVGAGFAGLYMLYRLRELELSVRVCEAGSDIGGTWFWNRYPGARCDVESMEYSYQFSEELQQEWVWSERYASQPEILRYVHHVADRFNLRPCILFNTRVTAAHFDEVTNRWTIETDAQERLSARFCIMATGCLSSTNTPRFKGLETFYGPRYHTGNWPHKGVDFAGKRVGLIGTGSSAIQAIPHIAKEAGHLVVFQRTANYSVPAHNGPLDPETANAIKADYAGFRQRNNLKPGALSTIRNEQPALQASANERRIEYEARWAKGGLGFLGAFGDLLLKREANDTAAEFVHNKIRAVVRDPEVAKALCPQQVIGCKRLCLDSGYYETFNRPNVSLVNLNATPIEEFTPAGVRVDAKEFPLDCIVFATGFDAMTGALNKIDIRGRDGRALREKWAAGPRTYLGIGSAGFPNLFTISGPGSPSVLTNMLPSIEQHVNWIANCIRYLCEHELASIEATTEAEDAWVAHVNAVADATLYPTCNSWYLGANIPGKPRVFMPYIGFPAYVEKCNEVAGKGYLGFAVTRGRTRGSIQANDSGHLLRAME